MSHARYHNACDFLPTCTAQKGWALSVFALSVTRHGRHADTPWALGLGSSGSASHAECFTRRQGALRASASTSPRLMWTLTFAPAPTLFCCFRFPDRPADFTGRQLTHQFLPLVFVPRAFHSSRQAPLGVASQRAQDGQTFRIVKEQDGFFPGEQKYNGSHKITQYCGYKTRNI